MTIKITNRVFGAMGITCWAHRKQVRRYSGQPYIVHPVAVALAVQGHGESAVVVALLHDVLEDCDAWMAHGQLGINDEHNTLLDLTAEEEAALDAISREEEESYGDYIKRVLGNELATLVKKADIEDNLRTLPVDHKLQARYGPTLFKVTQALSDAATSHRAPRCGCGPMAHSSGGDSVDTCSPLREPSETRPGGRPQDGPDAPLEGGG